MPDREKVWHDHAGNWFTGDHGTTPISADEARDELLKRLDGPPRSITIRGGLRGDIADFIADVADDPVGYGVACGLGFIAGLFLTAGLAWVWSWFL